MENQDEQKWLKRYAGGVKLYEGGADIKMGWADSFVSCVIPCKHLSTIGILYNRIKHNKRIDFNFYLGFNNYEVDKAELKEISMAGFDFLIDICGFPFYLRNKKIKTEFGKNNIGDTCFGCGCGDGIKDEENMNTWEIVKLVLYICIDLLWNDIYEESYDDEP